jgi:serine/threonine-protein kinase
MNPERWSRIEELVADALERDAAARSTYLNAACGDDLELRAMVQRLLTSAEASSDFLRHPLIDFPAMDASLSTPHPPTVPGYRVGSLIGRGGMGEVYLAERVVEDIHQTVALKVVRAGMATDAVLGRFQQERQILARLRHPHIAHLLDAGMTTAGLPWFAMEYVEGLPITEWCDHQRLPVRDRLTLFQTICATVHHAHQHLVIHRDIKPRNILVDPNGHPTLLDFGIGKILGDEDRDGDGTPTRSGTRLLTPEYAAPEQVRGETVTTATDVYSIGVVLYQLLVGRHPYLNGESTRPEVEQAVLTREPTRPSATMIAPDVADHRAATVPHLHRLLAGDLDTILLKALRKEPERRYSSAAAFAEDIGNYLRGLPVLARPDTLSYRTRKFVQRHTGAVIAASVGLLATGLVTVTTIVQTRRVSEEAARVTIERDKALEVRSFLMEMFGAAGGQRSVGDTATVRNLLDLQAGHLEENFGTRPVVMADMLDVLADGYDRLGLFAEAEPLARQALILKKELLGDDHPDVATSQNALGWILHQLGKSPEAEPLLREAIAIRRAAGPRHTLDLARSLNDLGVILTRLDRMAEAESVLVAALAIRQAAWGGGHRSVGITANNLAAVYFRTSRWLEAAHTMEIAVEALRTTLGVDHQRTLLALGNLAVLRREAGEAAAAESTYRQLLEGQRRTLGADHPRTASVLSILGLLVAERASGTARDDTLAVAEAMLREALHTQETLLGENHPEVGPTLDRLGPLLLDRGDIEGGTQALIRAAALYQRLYGNHHRRTAAAHVRLAVALEASGTTDRGLTMLEGAIADLRATAGAQHPTTGQAELELCRILAGRTRPAEATANCRSAATTLAVAPARYRHDLARARQLLDSLTKASNNR